MRKPRVKASGKWVFVPDSSKTPEEIEKDKMDSVTQMLSAGQAMQTNGPNYNPFAACEEFQNYFPGSNMVPDGGAWVLVKNPPFTQYTVPPLSIWFAEPWSHSHERFCSHRVKIMTPRGELGLYPREYSLVTDPGKYYEFVGDGMSVKFFGGGTDEGVPKDKLFYMRSRGISKKDALTMLIGEIKAHGVLWVETDREVAAVFSDDWPDDSRNATL